MGKARTRSNGEGSVYPEGDKWVAAITIAMGPDGRARRKKVKRDTKREAQKELAQLRLLKEKGARLLTVKQSTQQYLEYWLSDIKLNQVRKNSLQTYTTLLRSHVYPVIGHIILTKLTPEHVQEVVNQVARDRAPGTAQYVLTLLRMALGDAYKRDMILKNVATVVDPPKGHSKERLALTPEQCRTLLAHAIDTDEEGVYWVALLTGMRQGEILALRWCDIDLDAASIAVRWNLQEITDGVPILGEPKTESSRRVLYFHEVLIDVFKEQRRKQGLWQMKAHIAMKTWTDFDLVFTNTTGGAISNKILRRRFVALLRDAGLPSVHFHDLRHSCQSLLAELGVPERTSMDVLGHRDVETTRMVYTHSSEAGKRRAATQIGEVFADLRRAV